MGTMPYELACPMVFGRAGFGEGTLRRREYHSTDGDCRTCGGECKKPELAAQPPPTSKRRYPRLMRARIVDTEDAAKPGLKPRKFDAE